LKCRAFEGIYFHATRTIIGYLDAFALCEPCEPEYVEGCRNVIKDNLS